MPISSADARRAIYIDFETLRTTPADAALLGVLIGEDDEVLQVIVDEVLAPARVAKRQRTAAASLADAVETIVGRAEVDDRPIVGWSFFDRDRLIEARPDLEPAIVDRYVNALQIARPWRAKVYPSFKVEREDQFSPKHTLDQYAVLAEYPDADALTGAQPARWIRQVRQQLRAKDGRYRRISQNAKRHWHRLLDYNRHDLLALRHIVRRSTRELELWCAYERTTFCVEDGDRRVCFRAGSRSPRLDTLLARHGAERWAFITAWNPASQVLPARENARRHAELVEAVRALGLAALPGEGSGEDPSWKPEKSLLILDISRRKAASLGRRFGQLAIVVGRRRERSRLLSTADRPRGQTCV